MRQWVIRSRIENDYLSKFGSEVLILRGDPTSYIRSKICLSDSRNSDNSVESERSLYEMPL
jgi:hypothetical protein